MNTGNQSFQVDPISTNSTALLPIDYVLLGLTLPTAFLSIILILLLIPMIFVDRKRYHQNLLILRLQYIFAFILVTGGRFTMYICNLNENRQTPVKAYILWQCALIASEYGSTLLRSCWIVISLERGIATYYKKEYERNKFSIVWMILTASMYTIVSFFNFFHYYFLWSDNATFAYNFSLDLIGCISIFLLYRHNNVLLRAKYQLELSERYQVDENLRTLKFLKPYLIVGCMVTFFGNIIRLVVLQISPWFYTRIIRISFVVYICYILLGVIYNIFWIIRENRTVNETFYKMLKYLFGNRFQRIAPLNMIQTQDQTVAQTYFVMLERDWR